ncbi:MAG: AAA family ATPase [Spirochaetaceae bacterium]|nr:AAA family ATPase [Spirochaetaceae bacterium]
MAFINVNEMEKREKDIREQEPVKATYSINNNGDKFLFQIDTYGSANRANPDKVSQSISFDADNIRALFTLLSRENNSLFEYKTLDEQEQQKNVKLDILSTDISPLILYGPPGTGKTYQMQHEYIDRFSKDDCFVTTFHQSFSYEEFVEGLKPVLATEQGVSNQSSDVKYTIEKGVFYQACERTAVIAGFVSLAECVKASVDDKKQKMSEAINAKKVVLLCIDEINRANVSAVFGDLISLIEPSKRIGAKNEMIVQLPYSKEAFAVPANLMIVGTMNTTDRSIQLLDSALRRRFRFEELLPDYSSIKNETAKNILKAINARIRCLLDKDHQIGHSYFIDVESDLNIFNALKNCVIPLLEEYFYNDAQKIRQVLNEKDNSDNNFYVKDEEAEVASRNIESDFDDEKEFYQLNPKLSEVSDVDSAKTFISHISE